MNDEYLEQKMQELRELGESYGKAKSLVTSLEYGRQILKSVYDEAKFRWDMKLAEMKFERWKTLTIAQMKEYKQYGNKI